MKKTTAAKNGGEASDTEVAGSSGGGGASSLGLEPDEQTALRLAALAVLDESSEDVDQVRAVYFARAEKENVGDVVASPLLSVVLSPCHCSFIYSCLSVSNLCCTHVQSVYLKSVRFRRVMVTLVSRFEQTGCWRESRTSWGRDGVGHRL